MVGNSAGKVVLVTGATSGIGHAIAVRFAAESANVTALGRTAKPDLPRLNSRGGASPVGERQVHFPESGLLPTAIYRRDLLPEIPKFSDDIYCFARRFESASAKL